jgi:MSHA biogenesis protein MshO
MRRNSRSGFTLVEMIAVISIMAILASGVAVFLRLPLYAYQDAQRRASITEAADSAFALLKRDLQNALPNSVRVTSVGTVSYLEFLEVRTGGRYRADSPVPAAPATASTCPDTNADGNADENVIQFGVPDTCFTTLGAIQRLNAIVPNQDFVAVYNLGPGFPGADAYASGAATGGNKSSITGIAAGAGGENVVSFQVHTFQLDSPARRFHVIAGPVTYECDPGAGTIRRFDAYVIAAAQPSPPGGASALVAKGVSGCTMVYDQSPANRREGVVSMWLRFTDAAGGGAIDLFQQVQVNNVP